MKAVLISIQPKWCELIANGKKTVEVRKTKPKIETPFKCYIYCTIAIKKVNKLWSSKLRGKYYYYDDRSHNLFDEILNGKVIGEFVCDRIYKIESRGNGFTVGDDIALTNRIARESCLDFVDMKNYLETKGGYGWHISDLKIYDKPKKLVEFKTQLSNIYCKEHKKYGCDSHCISFNNNDFYCKEYAEWYSGLKRPPQNWCYVEEDK